MGAVLVLVCPRLLPLGLNFLKAIQSQSSPLRIGREAQNPLPRAAANSRFFFAVLGILGNAPRCLHLPAMPSGKIQGKSRLKSPQIHLLHTPRWELAFVLPRNPASQLHWVSSPGGNWVSSPGGNLRRRDLRASTIGPLLQKCRLLWWPSIAEEPEIYS